MPDETGEPRLPGWLTSVLVVMIGLLLGVGSFSLARGWADRGRDLVPSVASFRPPGAVFDQTGAASRLTEPAGPEVEPPSAEAALDRFLAAEVAGDAAAAFPLLDRRSREKFSSVEAWAIGRNDRIVPVTFRIGEQTREGETRTIVVDATHESTLDPFRGYVPARSRQRWIVRLEDRRWRVSARPMDLEPLLPAPAGATKVVQRWVDLRSACDTAGAEPLQRSSFIYGPPPLLEAPCAERGAWSAGAVGRLADAPDSSTVTSTFGPDSGVWSRVIPVRGPRSNFLVVVAALGDDWRVVAVIPGDSERN